MSINLDIIEDARRKVDKKGTDPMVKPAALPPPPPFKRRPIRRIVVKLENQPRVAIYPAEKLRVRGLNGKVVTHTMKKKKKKVVDLQHFAAEQLWVRAPSRNVYEYRKAPPPAPRRHPIRCLVLTSGGTPRVAMYPAERLRIRSPSGKVYTHIMKSARVEQL